MLQPFQSQLEKVHAAVSLFPRLTDPERAYAMTRTFSPDEAAHMYTLLGTFAFFDPRNPSGRQAKGI